MLDESAEPRDRAWINDYERTKTLSDRMARKAIAAGAPLSVVYPGVIYGPGEMTEGNIVVRHILDLVHGRLPALIGSPDRRWNYVYVDDVARGVALALEAPTPGGRYMLGGENVTLGDFYRPDRSGAPAPRSPRCASRTRSPRRPARRRRRWAGLRGTTPQLTPDLVEIYKHDWAYSSAQGGDGARLPLARRSPRGSPRRSPGSERDRTRWGER